MSDYFEIDFLKAGNGKSGDSIAIRYKNNGKTRIHVVDGGFQETGEQLVEHINKYFDNPTQIDAVVLTHPDGDHAVGLRELFDNFTVNELWMLRPWLYADELIHRFSRFSNVENLKKRLKEIYPNVKKLEDLADEHSVPIFEPFQNAAIGDFTCLAPSKEGYLDLIVESEKTPESTKAAQESLLEAAGRILKQAVSYIRAAWGEEVFPEDDTSPENNMSIVQFAELCEQKILLTGDAGRATLEEAISFAPQAGLHLPGIDRIQVPHHGSRHNVSSKILDDLLGPKLGTKIENFTAIISAAKDDKDHPRKAVIRAFMHRGAKVITTEENTISTFKNAPNRGWTSVQSIPYPDDQEE
ncbi:MAG: MBL fold metallo-hydrolase [Desulfobulbus sp.]|nr:MBL fold metallo-hydrolase [Desulfobulbus sp.]